MSAKKLVTFSLTLWMLYSFLPGDRMAGKKNKKMYILVNTLFNLVQRIGTNNDYIAGENDFPITPAHKEIGLGCGLMINMTEKLATQLVCDYLFGTEVKKEDPFDGETVRYRTYNNINILGSVIFKFGKKYKFFLSGGGGVNILNPYDDKELEGNLGSLIIISAPGTKVNSMLSFGGGWILNMKKTILKLEVLYNLILNIKKNSILLRLGIGV